MNFSQVIIAPIIWVVAILLIIVIINKFKRIFQMIYAWSVLIILITFTTGYYIGSKPQDILQSVRNREQLKCGINGELPGFSNGANPSEGFDADFCRVIAAAIFDDVETKDDLDNKIEFIKLLSGDRLLAVEEGRVDVLIRNTTWNVGRDIERNVDFGPMIFLDSQGFLVHEKSGTTEIADLNNKSVCVLPDTTSIENLNNIETEHSISFGDVITNSSDGDVINSLEVFERNSDIVKDYINKKDPICDVVTADKSQLYSLLSRETKGESYKIIPDKPITKEPLSPVVVGGNKPWHDIISYSIYATIHASELGISSTNIADYSQTEDLAIQNFLGIQEENNISKKLGLSNDFVQRIIRLVGNYDEIYVRNLNDIIPVRGVNRTWKDNGILISPPFDPIETAESSDLWNSLIMKLRGLLNAK